MFLLFYSVMMSADERVVWLLRVAGQGSWQGWGRFIQTNAGCRKKPEVFQAGGLIEEWESLQKNLEDK